MPIEVGIWKRGEKLQKVNVSSIDAESKFENALCEDLSILSPQLMLIGRQIPTDFGKFIDILAMDPDGNLTVVELKRNRTPREVVAQILDYESWVQTLSYDQIAELYAGKNSGKKLEEGFGETFGGPPEKLNQSHNLIVVASELDIVLGGERSWPATRQPITDQSDGALFDYFLTGSSSAGGVSRCSISRPRPVSHK